MKKTKIGVCIAAASMLSACGGGSSDAREVVRLNDTVEVSVGELSQSSRPTEHKISKIESVEPASELSVSYGSEGFVASSAELDHPVMGTYDVFMTKGNDILIQRYEVLGINTSASLSELKAYDIRDNYQDLLELSEAREVYQYFVDLGYLSETITPVQRDTRIAAFDVTGADSYATTQATFDDLLTTFEAYLNGEAGEDTLRASVELADQQLATHSAEALTHLRAVEDISATYMTALPDYAVEYVESAGRYSGFFHDGMISVDPDTQEVSYVSGFEILTPITGI